LAVIRSARAAAIWWAASLGIAACAPSGRRISLYVDPTHSRTVNIGTNLIIGTLSRCESPVHVPTADISDLVLFDSLINVWEQHAQKEHVACIAWFSRTEEGRYVGVQEWRMEPGGGLLAFFPKDTSQSGWTIQPW
jgi:hypothetical protein